MVVVAPLGVDISASASRAAIGNAWSPLVLATTLTLVPQEEAGTMTARPWSAMGLGSWDLGYRRFPMVMVAKGDEPTVRS
jgi:hypothetical protein